MAGRLQQLLLNLLQQSRTGIMDLQALLASIQKRADLSTLWLLVPVPERVGLRTCRGLSPKGSNFKS